MFRVSLVLLILAAVMAARVAHKPLMTTRAPRGRGATVVLTAWVAEPALPYITRQER